MASVGDGYQKLHNVEQSIIKGDVKGADQVLRTINDRIDQDIFKSLISSHCDSKAYGLPACTLDGDGIHFGGDKKMTLTATDGALGMRNDQPSLSDRARNAVDAMEGAAGRAYRAVKESVSTNDLSDSLHRSGTSDSNLNRRLDAQIVHAEGRAGM